MLGFGKRENAGGIVPPEENRLARETIMPPPPAPPANQAKKLPEMHINIFAFMGNDMERVQKTIRISTHRPRMRPDLKMGDKLKNFVEFQLTGLV